MLTLFTPVSVHSFINRLVWRFPSALGIRLLRSVARMRPNPPAAHTFSES